MAAQGKYAFQQFEQQIAGTQDAFQKSAFAEPDPSRAFQQNAWQTNVEVGGFQDSAFADSGFQETPDAFADDVAQWNAFQLGQAPVLATVAAPFRFARPAEAGRRGRLIRRLANRAIVTRAPFADQPPATQVVARKTMVSRIVRARRRNQRPIIRSRVADQPPADQIVLRQVTQLRPIRARVRRRKPLILRGATFATPTPLVRNRVLVRLQLPTRPARARLLRHKPLVLRARSVPTATPLVKPTVISRRQRRPVRRQRRPLILGARVAPLLVYVRPRILGQSQKRTRFLTRRPGGQVARAPSVTTPTPLVRKGVQVVRADRARPRRFARLRHKPVILGSVRGQAAGFVPYLRPVVLVKRRRTPIARLRHNQPVIRRSFVAAVRTRAPIVVARRHRKPLFARRRRQLIRPSSAPQFRLTLTQSRRARRPLPRRRHSQILRAPLAAVIPGAITPVAYGDVLVSDREQFTILVGDNVCYELMVGDTEMFLVGVADNEQFSVQVRDQETADVLTGDRPGG